MPPQPIWVTPISFAVILATAFHLQLDALPPDWVVGLVAVISACTALLGFGFMQAPTGLMAWGHPGRWRLKLGVHLLICGLVHPAWGLAGLTWAWATYRASQIQSLALPEVWEGQRVIVQGQVVSLPERTEHGWRMRVQVHAMTSIADPTRAAPAIEMVSLSVPHSKELDGQDQTWDAEPQVSQIPRVGEIWRWTVKLKAPHGLFNPHGDDVELRAWAQGIQAWATQSQSVHQATSERTSAATWHPSSPLRLWVERWREQVRDRLMRDRTEEDAQNLGVVVALVLGDQSAIADSDWKLFRATGIAHLMSISGLHITAWALMCAALIRRLWRFADARGWAWSLHWPAPHAAAILGLMASWAYALFSGWGLPAQRTVFMLALAVVLNIQGHQWPWMSRWLGIAAVLVIWQPSGLMQPGFWLSFLAVALLLAETPRPSSRTSGWRSMLQTWIDGVRIQWRLTLLMLPLTWVIFGTVSWVSAWVNLWAIPWVSLVILPLAVASVWMDWALTWAQHAVGAMRAVLEVMASWDWALGSWPAAAPWQMGLAVLGGMVMAWPTWPWRWRSLGLAAVVPALMGVRTPSPPWGELQLMVVDVGQGQAVVIRTQHQTWLYDAGPGLANAWNAGEQVIIPLLKAKAWSLQGMILSHADSDHVGGAAALLKTYPEMQWVGSLPKDHPLQGLRTGQACRAGMRWWVDGVRFEVLHPVRFDPVKTTNRNSCVLKLQAASASVLLTGDLESRDETALVQSGAALKSDVLLVGHHGSKTSSTPAFLEAVQAQWGLVQSGYLNAHGHPHESVLKALNQAGLKVRSSPACGAMHWQSIQADEVLCERDLRRRYWHHKLHEVDQRE